MRDDRRRSQVSLRVVRLPMIEFQAAVAVLGLQCLKQTGNIGRVVLSVAIERGNPRCPGGTHASTHRGTLTAAHSMPQQSNLRHRFSACLQNFCRGGVDAAVVDEDHFKSAQVIERCVNFARQGHYILCLVADRNDDGQLQAKRAFL